MDVEGESKGDQGVLGFDLRSYAARYRGRTKVDRLVFIAGHSKEHRFVHGARVLAAAAFVLCCCSADASEQEEHQRDILETIAMSRRHSPVRCGTNSILTHMLTLLLIYMCVLFSSLSLSADAYRMAVNEIKQSFDTIKYVDVVEKATKADLPGFSLDQAWMDNIVQKVSAQQEKLDQELARFKTNMIKESVRVSCEVPKEGVRCGGSGGVEARGVVRTSVVISRARRSINHPRA